MAGGLESQLQAWDAQGYHVVSLTLLLNNSSDGPPTIDGALTWKNNFGIVSGYVAPDPGFKMVPGTKVGTPQITIVDPRNMKVLLVQEGWGGQYPPVLEQTAIANQ